MTIKDILARMGESPHSVQASHLARVCSHFFGDPRQNTTSHRVYKTPWPGDPRLSIQRGKSGEAKPYQVRQILNAIEKLEEE